MIKYTFRDDPLPLKNVRKAQPQRIGEELAKIAASNKGHLTPKAVVNEARNNRSVLHKHFEWNDQVAAESFRLDQARGLIRSIRVVNEDDDTEVPAFVSITEKSGTSYRTIGEVLQSADLQAQALRQAERDLAAYERRLAVFDDICVAIKDAREKIASRRSSLESGLRA